MLKNKVAIITGGTRGIGFETVKVFLENNAKVVLFGSKMESVENAVRLLKEENKNYEVFGLYPNLSNELEVQEAFKEVKEKYGSIDILINNAGMSSSTPLTSYTIEEYDKIMDLNVKSVFICSKNIIPYMEENNGGVIINTSSMVSIYGQPSGSMYAGSKFFVNGLTKSLARELGP